MTTLGVATRMRLYGLAPFLARQEEAGSAIGRLHQCGMLSKPQFEAGTEYEKITRAYQKAMLSKQLRSAADYSGSGGYDGSEGTDDAYVAEYREAIRRWREMMGAIVVEGSLAVTAVDLWSRDVEAFGMLDDLRLGLAALVRLWKLT